MPTLAVIYSSVFVVSFYYGVICFILGIPAAPVWYNFAGRGKQQYGNIQKGNKTKQKTRHFQKQETCRGSKKKEKTNSLRGRGVVEVYFSWKIFAWHLLRLKRGTRHNEKNKYMKLDNGCVTKSLVLCGRLEFGAPIRLSVETHLYCLPIFCSRYYFFFLYCTRVTRFKGTIWFIGVRWLLTRYAGYFKTHWHHNL